MGQGQTDRNAAKIRHRSGVRRQCPLAGGYDVLLNDATLRHTPGREKVVKNVVDHIMGGLPVIVDTHL